MPTTISHPHPDHLAARLGRWALGLAAGLAGLGAGLGAAENATAAVSASATAAAPTPAVSREAMRADPAVKAQLRAVQAQALGARDLWTALLAETWAQNLKLDLRNEPALGNTLVIGDPAFACPDDLIGGADLGDRVVAITRRRWHLFLPDGRPAAPSVAFGQDAYWGAVSPGGTAAVAVMASTPPDRKITTISIHVVAQPGSGEKAGWTTAVGTIAGTSEEKGDSDYAGHQCVADDGSAAAVNWSDHNGDHLVVFTAKGASSTDLHAVQAIGPGAAWILANNDQGRLCLVVGDKRTAVQAACAGPNGMAAVVIDHVASLVARDGKLVPLAVAMNFGDGARALTAGRWLGLCSGDHAAAVAEVDILGVEQKPTGEQPRTVALWRWDDLIADAAAPAVQKWSGNLEPCRFEAAGLLRWHDRQIDIIDLAGRTPVVRPWAKPDHPVAAAWEQLSKVLVVTGDNNGMLILDIAGRVVGKETGEIQVLHGNWIMATTKDHAAYELVKLAVDPAGRTRVKLPLSGEWGIADNHYQQRILAIRADKWSMMDYTGKVVASDGPRPGIWEFWPPNGRFYQHFGRFFPKTAADEGPPAAHLAPRDAWMIGRAMLVLDREGQVLATGRKRGEWLELGRAPDATGFAGRQDELDLTADDGHVVAAIAAGPALAAGTGNADPLPSGAWRINGLDFIAPHGGAMTWNGDVGFTPSRLRNPPNGEPNGLVALTASLVLIIDPAAAASVGRH
jgi:hypothetical protein